MVAQMFAADSVFNQSKPTVPVSLLTFAYLLMDMIRTDSVEENKRVGRDLIISSLETSLITLSNPFHTFSVDSSLKIQE